MKRVKLLLITILLLLPQSIYAYSDRVIVGGETIGIEVHSKGVYVVGFYKVNGKEIGSNAGFMIGDIIKKIDNNDVSDINSLNKYIDNPTTYKFLVSRNGKDITLNLKLEEENDIIKTGLYVKDQINGIGTLSYIDPETKIFGSLGHEILESSSFSKFDIDSGNIYKAEVSNIKKSINGVAGEKNAKIDRNSETGNINKNEIEGIFGRYTDSLDNKESFEVGDANDIKKGSAYIRTNINNDKIESFKINILSIDDGNTTKNILFEITDRKLLNSTGGIIQGMSGSPIIQDNKIIGVVNYVIIDDIKRGYGIFITKMLEEGDKILS